MALTLHIASRRTFQKVIVVVRQADKDCGHVELIAHFCKSRFCPTCGKHATDVWAKQVLNGFLDFPYHHSIIPVVI